MKTLVTTAMLLALTSPAFASSAAKWDCGKGITATAGKGEFGFRYRALSYFPWRLPPLLHRHKEIAGIIEDLSWDTHGRLILQARVDHEEARRCGGLSVAATIEKYRLVNVDDPMTYHAEILQSTLDEISLTPTPADERCIVTSRLPSNPANETYDLALTAIEKMQQALAVLKQMNSRANVDSNQHLIQSKRDSNHALPKSAPPKSPSQFSQLVQQISMRN